MSGELWTCYSVELRVAQCAHSSNVRQHFLPEPASVGESYLVMSLKAIGELDLVRVWVNPDHTLGAAFHLLSGYEIPAMPVRDGDRILGVIEANMLLGHPKEATAQTCMQPVLLTVESNDPVRNVAVQMAKFNTSYAIVADGGRFRGIVTAIQLLQEMSRSWDPLTGLSWSDQLREWGVEMLRAGREITIIFIDIDNFGRYNKVHGHIVGDRILKMFANILNQSVDTELDVLVRYGGDEFTIGTTRTRTDAERLAHILEARLASVSTQEPSDTVSASIGLFGGRRTTERENTHYASTIDALINLASKDCLAKKRSNGHATPPSAAALQVSEVQVGTDTVTVRISSSSHSVTNSRPFESAELQFAAVAQATLEAAEELAPGRSVTLGEISIAEPRPGVEVLEVALSRADGKPGPIGRCDIGGDIHLATALATLRAFLAAE